MPEQLVPETRLERFLSSIAYNTDVPDERRNRLERWLGAILKMNAPPDAPYDRLERWLKEIYENADYSAQFSGLNVEFWSRGNEQIKSLIVDIKPYQDFNGYDKPWAPGAGKNLVGIPNFTLTKPSERYKNFNLDAPVPPGTYTCSLVVTNYENSTHQTEINFNGAGAVKMFGVYIPSGTIGKVITKVTTTGEITYIYAYINSNNPDGTTITIEDIQLEEGRDATEFEPYANVCPITGFDQITVKRHGELETDSPLIVDVALGQTVYGGYIDVITGELTVTHGNIASYDGEEIDGEWLSSIDLYYPDTNPTEGAQVVYELDVPLKSQLSSNQIATLVGTNHVKATLVNGTTEFEADITLKV